MNGNNQGTNVIIIPFICLLLHAISVKNCKSCDTVQTPFNVDIHRIEVVSGIFSSQ